MKSPGTTQSRVDFHQITGGAIEDRAVMLGDAETGAVATQWALFDSKMGRMAGNGRTSPSQVGVSTGEPWKHQGL